mgnify:CR=1 FL=1
MEDLLGIEVEYTDTWRHGSTLDDDDALALVVSSWKMTEGNDYMYLKENSVVTEIADEGITSLDMVGHLSAALRDGETTAQYYADFHADLIACVDGLKGFPDAINTVYPQTQVQLCIVHMVRNSLKLVPWKDYKAVTGDLKRIYQSVTEEEGLMALDQFEQRWDSKYLSISRSWRSNWQKVSTIYN